MLPLLLLLASCRPTIPGRTGDTGPMGGDSGAGAPELARGLLQFKVVHNMQDDGCLAKDDCFLELEAGADIAEWLDEIEAYGPEPVLHWDRSVPWVAFAETPPSPAERVAFYDARLDSELLSWVDAFAEHFEGRGGYVAASILQGSRDQLAPARLGPDQDELAFGPVCPQLTPELVIEIEGVEVPVARAWQQFVLYLHDKLGPNRLALGVELDLFASQCPAQWPGLVELYRDTYDAVRAEVDPEIQLFATLTVPGLLAWDGDRCDSLAWGSCTAEPPEAPAIDAETCFPLDRTPLDDLSEGGRLDALALSFYPDGLLMAPPGQELVVQATLDSELDSGTCTVHARLPELADPLDRLAALGWTGPLLLAETSARSCESRIFLGEGSTRYRLQLPATPDSATWWMRRLHGWAEEQQAELLVWSFLRDYPLLGEWLVEESVLDDATWSLLNAWVCSGLQTEDGADKAGLAELWEGLGP